MGPTHRSGHGHIVFSLFMLKIRRLLQVCGQSHGSKPALFVATGLLACPWPGTIALDHPSDGSPVLCSTCSSLTEIKKILFQPPQNKNLGV